MKKFWIIIVRIIFFFLFVIAVVLLFLPTMAHRYIEKNSKELVGRKITMNDLDLNYASFSLSIDDLVLYELNDADTFFAFSYFKVNAEPWRLIKKEYAFKEFLLDSFYVYTDYDGEHFNFDDFITSEVDSVAVETIDKGYREVIRFSLHNINIQNGEIVFYDKTADNRFRLENIGLHLPNLAWDNKQADMGINLRFGRSGGLAFNGSIDRAAQKYQLEAQIDSLQLYPFSNYLEPYANTSGIEGTLDNRLVIHGSLSQFDNIVISGNAVLHNFIMKDLEGTPVIEVAKTAMVIDSFDIMNNYYHIGEISMHQPQVIAEVYDSSSNLWQLFAPYLEEVEMPPVDSISGIAKELVPVRYFVDSMVMHDGIITLTDHSLNRPFNYKVSDMEAEITGISYEAEEIPVTFSMLLNNEGILKGKSDFSINDPYNFDLTSEVDKLDLVSFSPYSEYYIARPIVQGRLNYSNEVEMTREEFSAENKILISELELGTKTEDEKKIKAPVKLGLYILKDKDDNIEMDVPMWGNPTDPDFDMGKIVWQTLSGFIVKVATEPFGMLGNLIGTNPEHLKKMDMVLTQDSLDRHNVQTLEKLANILDKKEEIIFVLTQETPAEKEMEALAVKNVCSAYLLEAEHPTTHADTVSMVSHWEDVNRMDTAFINYVSRLSQLDDTASFENQCIAITGKDELLQQFTSLVEKRNDVVHNYLLETLQVDSSLVEVRSADLLNIRAQTDHPMYRIEVSVK
ncbi:MAG: DUF748 domain-containing protein [Bacteroidota bacterium]